MLSLSSATVQQALVHDFRAVEPAVEYAHRPAFLPSSIHARLETEEMLSPTATDSTENARSAARSTAFFPGDEAAAPVGDNTSSGTDLSAPASNFKDQGMEEKSSSTWSGLLNHLEKNWLIEININSSIFQSTSVMKEVIEHVVTKTLDNSLKISQ